MGIWIDDLRSFVPYQDGAPITDGERVKSVDFRGMVVDYNSITGMLTVGPTSSSQRAEVDAATTAALAANTRTGNTLTASANGAFPAIDGVSLGINDRLLVKDEVTLANNGWYYLATAGSVSTPWQLTRTTDADVTAEFVTGAASKVLNGTVNAGKWFSLVAGGAFVLNTSNITFLEYFPQSTSFKDAVRVATTTSLPANSRASNNISATANGALPAIDGVSLVVGDRILVRNEISDGKNGIFRVTSLGSGGSPWTLARASDLQVAAQAVPGIVVPVSEGTVNGNKLFIMTTDAPITLNTTLMGFSLVAAGGSAGASGNINYSNGAGGWTTAVGITVVNTDSFAFGSTPATTGTLRGTNGFGIYVRNAADSANIAALSIGSDNVLQLGDGTNAAEVDIKAATNIDIVVGATLEYRFNSTSLDLMNNALLFGTTPATTGLIRVPHGAGQIILAARNQANSGDATILTWGIGGNNWLIYGNTTAAVSIYNVASGGTHTWWVNDVTKMTLSATSLDIADNSLTNVGDFDHDGTNFGMFGTAPTTKKTVTGSRAGNAALASLLTQLASYGMVTDSSSA